MYQLEKHWYRKSFTWLTILLLPFAWLFHLIILIRYFLYHINFKKSVHFPVPVIVVGNITLGGTGKTPFVIWLANYLRAKGFQPGIVLRGVGGKKHFKPIWVTANLSPELIGDEAILLAKSSGSPIVACIDRVAAVKELLNKSNCDVVISDDGLQHYRLDRDIEIVIVDGVREFGNKQLFPAGPLREPITRLKSVDFIVANGGENFPWKFNLIGKDLVALKNNLYTLPLQNFSDQKVHAIAAIGNPERFFASLRTAGLQLIEHSFPDHYLYQKSDIYFDDELPVIMTEKDAVKCVSFADDRYWMLPVELVPGPGLGEKILAALRK